MAVGIADGALLGPYQHMMAPLEVKVEFPEDTMAVSSAGTASTSVMTAGCATGGGHSEFKSFLKYFDENCTLLFTFQIIVGQWLRRLQLGDIQLGATNSI